MRKLSGLEPSGADRSLPDDYFDQTKNYNEIYRERGLPWTKEDDYILKTHFYNGSTIEQLSKELNRSRTAILSRLGFLYSKSAADMNALFDRAKLLLGKKRVIRKNQEPSIQNQEIKEDPALVSLRNSINLLEAKDDTVSLSEIFSLLQKGQQLVLDIYKSKAQRDG